MRGMPCTVICVSERDANTVGQVATFMHAVVYVSA